ncbi:MAG TPA: AlkA N-terminal domain-containing protein [Acidimicrobiales bacterium]|nr:AlkA N-terminal domain-containing protein [Acidimicrobiales bacterium]
MIDDERCYRVAASRDGRFDGLFVTAVLTTGIYCRPSCPARTPARANVRFYPTPAAAQEAGFRACKRCRPDSAPGSPDWDLRADVVARAVRLIGDGAVEREGVGGLAGRLGYGPRQLHRLMSAEIGTGPLRLALAHRMQTARSLLEHTGLPVTEVAWAAGFSSIRRFNEAVRSVYRQSPSQIRAASRPAPPGRAAASGPGGPGPAADGGMTVLSARLAYRPPMDIGSTLGFLGRRAVPGVEEFDGTRYRAAVRLPHGPAVVAIPAEVTTGRRPHVECEVQLSDVRDYPAAVSRLRRLLDLDADPAAVAADLGNDRLLGPLVATRPGLRVPGTMSPDEVAVRAVLGQQVSVAAARVVAGRLAALHGGDPLGAGDPVGCADPAGGAGGPLRPFPTAEALADADPATFPLPRARAATVHRLAAALAGGRIDLRPGCDRDRAERELLALPGIGPWTAAYIRMRALGDPDVYLPGDRALERAAGPADRRYAEADRWKPWRSYAVVHLWGSLDGPPTARLAGRAATDPDPEEGR